MSSTSSSSSSTKPEAKPEAKAAPRAAERLTGKPATVTITVESSARNPSGRAMQGLDAVTIILETDGYGHWRTTNLDSPLFASQAEAEAWITSEAVPDGEIVATEPAAT
jgi:hypothetical protein